jgi:hypothetical protein
VIPHIPDPVAQPLAWLGVLCLVSACLVITMLLRLAQKAESARYQTSEDAEGLAFDELRRRQTQARREWTA